MIKDHVLLPKASQLDRVDEEMKKVITPGMIRSVLEEVPEEWLLASRDVETVDEAREVYEAFLLKRLENSEVFLTDAKHARETLI